MLRIVSDNIRRRAMNGVIAFAGFLGAALPATAQAAGVVIGPFCIEGVELTRNEDQRTVEVNGYWTPAKLQYPASGSRTGSAQIAIFDAVLPKTQGLYSCSELTRMFASRNINVVLTGSISKLSLAANLFTATGQGAENAVQIDTSKLRLEVDKVTSGQLKLAGGIIQLKDKSIKLSNVNTMFANGSTIVGVLEVVSSNLALTGAKFLVGGAQFAANMKAPDNKSQSIRLNLSTKGEVLWEGAFESTAPVKLADNTVNLAGLSLGQAVITANQLRIDAAAGAARSHFKGLAGHAASLTVSHSMVTTGLAAPTLSFQGMETPIVQTINQWSAGPATISQAVFASTYARVKNQAGSELLHGAFKGQFATWSAQLVDGSTTWTQADAEAINFFSPAGSMSQLTLSLKGPFANPQMSGGFGLTNFALGGMAIKRDTLFNFSNLTPRAVLHVPMKLNSPSRSGTISFADRDQAIELTAGLSRALLEADLQIDLGQIKNSRLVVQPEKFQIGLFSAVATQPFLAGTAPAFGDLELSATNTTELDIGAVCSGQLELKASLLTMGQPIIRMGRKGSNSRAAITLNSNGAVTLGYDVGKNEVGLLAGNFEAHNSEFKMLDRGAEIDLSGVVVRDPLLQLGSFRIAIVKTGNIGVGTAALGRLTATGSLVYKPSDPEHPNEITYSGSFARPLTSASADAAAVRIAKVLEMDLISVQKLDVALTAVSANFSGGAKISDGTLALSADGLATLKVNDQELQKFNAARVAASGKIDPGNGLSVNGSPGFSIQVAVDGFSDHLNGSGSAQLDRFTGSKQSEVKIKFRCKGSDHLEVPIEYNFGVSGAALAVTYTDGRFLGEGGVGPLILAVHSKSGNECNTDVTKHVIARKGAAWTDGICSRGLHFYHCRWESPEISYAYHFKLAIRFGGGEIILTNPQVRLTGKGLNVCNMGAVQSKVILIGGDVPQIDTSLNVPGAEAIVNALLDLSFEAVESLVANSILDQANWLVDTVGTTGGNLYCLL
jgi:hypothetical protein